MIFKSGSGSSWYLDLADESELKKELPMNNLVVKNNSDYTLDIYINDTLEMVIESRNTDTKIGKNFRTLTLVSEGSFSDNEIIIDVGKNMQTTLTPYNPAWDALQTDFSKFASGTDARLSTNNINHLKYTLNSHKGLSSLTRIDIKGSGAIGTYTLTFNDNTAINGSVPLNGTILDTKRYTFNSEDALVNGSFTSCSLAGIIADYKSVENKIDSHSIITGNGNFRDDSLTTYVQGQRKGSGIIFLKTETELQYIDNINCLFAVQGESSFYGALSFYYIDENDTSQLIFSQLKTGAGYTTYVRHEAINTNIKGIVCYVSSNHDAYNGYVRIYDIIIN